MTPVLCAVVVCVACVVAGAAVHKDDAFVFVAFRAAASAAWAVFFVDDVAVVVVVAAVACAVAVACVAAIDVRAGVVVGVVAGCVDGAVAVAVVVSFVVTLLMKSRRFPRLRFALHLWSFVGLCAVALPLLSSSPLPSSLSALPPDALSLPLWPRTTSTLALSALLLTAGTLLLAQASSTLLRDGGTPDPFDPPAALQTGGIYAHVRHPMQLAEVFVVVAAAVFLGSAGALLWAASFSFALLIGLRIVEERGLADRYGDAFREWRARVPAFVPRLGGAR